jgi:DNA replication protein DnaC
MGIPSRYHDAHLTKWLSPANTQKMIFEWINEPKNFLVHIGFPNCGKTYMCAALINYLSEKNKDCSYVKADKVIQEMKSLIESGKSEYNYLNIIADKEILFIDGIDDIHLESDWQLRKIEELINRRFENLLPTVITSKLTSSQIESIFGAGLKGKLFNQENKIYEKWSHN